MTIADDQLTVRLTRDVWHLARRHVDLARAVSAVARRQGAVVDRARAQEVQFAVAAPPDGVDVGFWRAVLGYSEASDDNGVDPLGHGSTVWPDGALGQVATGPEAAGLDEVRQA
jgi:4a-hydroxytetrahydrobiopterin dehydratase